MKTRKPMERSVKNISPKNSKMKPREQSYTTLITNIGTILEDGRKKAVHAVNQTLVQTYWDIGKQIVEYETVSGESAGYGSGLFERIAKELRERYGKGFSRANIIY